MNRHILQPADVTVVGRITRPHGYKGSLKIHITHPGAEDLETEWVLLIIDQKPVPFFIESLQRTGEGWIVKVEGVDNEAGARALKSIDVALPSSEIPETEATGTHRVIGYEVVDNASGKMGVVKEVVDHGFQELILVEDSTGKSFMVPFVPPIIQDINADRQIITVQLPEGLSDLN